MKRKINFTFILSLFAIFSNGQKILSLEDCFKLAKENNLEINKAFKRLELNKLQLKEIDLDKNSNISVGINNGLNFGRNINPTSNQFESNTIYYNGLGFNASLDLLNWGQRKIQKNINTLNGSILETEIESNEIEIRSQILFAYIQVLLFKEQIKMLKWQISNRQETIKIANKKIKASVLSEYDLPEIKGQLINDSSNLENAIENLNKLKLILKINIGYDLEKEIDIVNLKEQNTLPNLNDFNETEMFNIIISTNPKFKIFNLQNEILNKQDKLAKILSKPTLALSAGINSNFANNKINISTNIADGLYNNTLNKIKVNGIDYFVQTPNYQTIFKRTSSPIIKQLQNNFRQNIGLSLNFPLLKKGTYNIALEKNKIQRKINNLSNEILLQKEKEKIYLLKQEAKAAFIRYNSFSIQDIIFQKILEGATKKLELGKISVTEYNILQNNFLKNKFDASFAYYEFYYKTIILKESIKL